MTPERAAELKRQALKAVAARAANPRAPGISMVAISPHEALLFCELLAAHEASESTEVVE